MIMRISDLPLRVKYKGYLSISIIQECYLNHYGVVKGKITKRQSALREFQSQNTHTSAFFSPTSDNSAPLSFFLSMALYLSLLFIPADNYSVLHKSYRDTSGIKELLSLYALFFASHFLELYRDRN